jgi:hypothetical protein
MLATTFVWRKKIAAEVVVTRKGSPLEVNTYADLPNLSYRPTNEKHPTPTCLRPPHHVVLCKHR